MEDTNTTRISEIFSSQPIDKLCPLKEALWLCTQSFNVKGSAVHQSDYKRVWLFTNDDHPNHTDVGEQNSIVQVAKDGAETGVEISLWHMDRREGEAFDVCRFYHRLLTVDDEGGATESAYEHRVMGACGGSFDDMMDLAKRKEHKKRRLGSVRMHISGGGVVSGSQGAVSSATGDVEVAVGIYKTVMPAVRPSYEWLQASTNEPAIKMSTMIDTSTGQVIPSLDSTLDSSERVISTYIEVGGSRVYLSKEDMAACRMLAVDPAGPSDEESKLKVLFFAPAASLTIDMNLSAPCLVRGDLSISSILYSY